MKMCIITLSCKDQTMTGQSECVKLTQRPNVVSLLHNKSRNLVLTIYRKVYYSRNMLGNDTVLKPKNI